MGENNLETKLGFAIQLIREGAYDEALKILHELRAQNPDSIQALEVLALAYNRLGDPGLKINFFESVRELKHPDFLESLGRAYREGGKTGKSREVLEEAVSIAGDNYRLWIALGETLEAEGRLKDAVEAYEKSHQLSRKDPDTAALLAGAYSKMGDYSRACVVYEGVLMKSPYHPQARAGVEVCRIMGCLDDFSGKANVLSLIMKEDYSKDFATALKIALSAMANADQYLATSEIKLIGAALNPFREILPGSLDEELEKNYPVEEMIPYAENLPHSARLLIFQLSCELAGIDRKLVGSELKMMVKLSEILGLSPGEADAIMRRTRPISWQVLEHEVKNFLETLDIGDLELLLFNWERYWRQFREAKPLSIQELWGCLREVYEYMEVDDKSGSRMYRFNNIEKVFDLQLQIKKRVFHHGIVIANSLLSADNLDKIILKLYDNLAHMQIARRFASMTLVNRLTLALQQFCELFPTDTWSEPFMYPPELEVMIDRPDRALKTAREVGLI